MAGIMTPMQQALLQGESGPATGPSNAGPGYGGRASAAAHGVGMGNYGRIGQALGLGIGAMVGAPISGMRMGKTMGLRARQNQMAQGYTDVVNNAAGYGIGQAEVDAGMVEGGASQANSSQMSGPNANLGGLGTGGQGGIDSAGNGGSASGGSSCFITTATAHQFGWSDDCRVLNMLRKFRDDIVLKMPTGEADIKTYYEVAPNIAGNMTSSEAMRVWHKYIKKSVKAIAAGKYRRAYVIYKSMMLELMKNDHASV